MGGPRCLPVHRTGGIVAPRSGMFAVLPGPDLAKELLNICLQLGEVQSSRPELAESQMPRQLPGDPLNRKVRAHCGIEHLQPHSAPLARGLPGFGAGNAPDRSAGSAVSASAARLGRSLLTMLPPLPCCLNAPGQLDLPIDRPHTATAMTISTSSLAVMWTDAHERATLAETSYAVRSMPHSPTSLTHQM